MTGFIGIIVLLAVATAHGERVQIKGRIVGGFPIAQQLVPYQVSLQYYGSHFCGGSIIAPKWILTAQHCTVGKAAIFLTVRVGSALLEAGGDVHAVSKIIQHEQFNRGTYDFDYALLQLSARIVLDQKTKAVISLPEADTPIHINTPILVSGWGYTLSSASNEKVRGVIVMTTNQEECHQKYIGDGGITGQMVCACDTGKDSCNGDSGGPARDLETGRLLGIVSFGMACADDWFPGVYARVASVRPWILANAGV